jgi:hypothetical protein
MKDPTITIGLSEDGRLLFERDDEAPLNECSRSLSALADKGYDGACLAIGNVVMNLLVLAHKDDITRHPALLPPEPVIANTTLLVLELITRSDTDKTRAYVTAIDTLLARHPDDLDRSGMPGLWRGLRERLLQYPD